MKKIVLIAFAVFSIHNGFAQPSTKYDISGYWYAFDAEGKHLEDLDIYVFYNSDIEAYYAQYTDYKTVQTRSDGSIHMEDATVLKKKSKIVFSTDSTFAFSIDGLLEFRDSEDNGRQFYVNIFVYDLELRYYPQKRKIVGEAKRTRSFEAMGNSDYPSVFKAINDGRGKVAVDCSGNCGSVEIIYRK